MQLNFPFNNFSMFTLEEYMIYYIREKYWYIDTKCDDKEFMQFK